MKIIRQCNVIKIKCIWLSVFDYEKEKKFFSHFKFECLNLSQ